MMKCSAVIIKPDWDPFYILVTFKQVGGTYDFNIEKFSMLDDIYIKYPRYNFYPPENRKNGENIILICD